MADLINTGERVIEGAQNASIGAYLIYIMHTAAYSYAAELCAGKSVLDLGCGSGYGSAGIAKVAKSVQAVDVDEDAIAFACSRYSQENLHYSLVQSGEPLPFRDESFDVVLSFQVIEHVQDDVAYLQEARRVVKPNGTVVIVTPDRCHRLLPGQKPWNRWHVREYSAASLSRRVAGIFGSFRLLKMGAPRAVANIEIRRYRTTKWLTLPITLPFVPEMVRRKSLDFLHSIRSRPARIRAKSSGASQSFGFDESSLVIGEDPVNPLNLIVVATKQSE